IARQEYASIMRGIREANFENSSVPCQLLLSGDHSFPLVMNSQGQVLMAASQYGSGRIVVFSHETEMYTSADVTINALHWLKGDQSGNVVDSLRKAGFQLILMDSFSSGQGVGVYLTDAYSIDQDAHNIVAFMKSGGGVLIGGQAWWWSSQTGENTLLQFPGNKVSGVAGIHFSDLYADKERVTVWPDIPTSWRSVKPQYDLKKDLQTLLQGVSDFEWQEYLASEILVHGQLSFPIGTTQDGRPFIAGGYYGKGRVVVAAHEAFLRLESLTGLWDNVLHWLDQNRQGVVGVEPEYALNVMKRSGLDCELTDFRSDLSVFVRTAYRGDNIEEIQKFVAEGGGLLIGGHAWNWAQKHPGQNYLTHFSGNKMLNPMGMSLLSGTISGGCYKAPDTSVSIEETYHFHHLLFRLASYTVLEEKELTPHEEKCLQKLADDCVSFLSMKNFNCYSNQQIVGVLTDILKKTGLPQVHTSNSPAKSAKDHFIVKIAAAVYDVCSCRDELLHFLFKDIPVLKTIRDQPIHFNGEQWISTGLYLTPGMKTYLSVPTDFVNKGWQVQINCHTDILNHKTLLRAPSVYKRFPVTSEMMQVHNLWGGLIYLIAPPHTKVTGAKVVVQVAVSAPYYKSGEDLSVRLVSSAHSPSPWAELEFENIILTVPSDLVKNLERPDELAALWDRVMKAVADLAAIPHKFERKERIVCDVQISAGSMHAGYPVMGQNAYGTEMVTAKEYQTMWGPIHELGHNQQRPSWEFRPHTTDATNNLWSVYVHETVLKAHPDLTPENRRIRIKEYIKQGRRLGNWKDWVALETYLQLQEKFGWSPFKSVFGAYHKIENVPGDNKGKMNLFAVTFSKTVGMDLSGFFKAWGWPIAAETEKKLSDLPAWTDHPMAQYY
uniref:Peptidase M60 domain-containing protein n=1 Tax=Neogobius melanostomus TaxID=47308 RepID=A0A8C6UCA9_9GOBI